MTEKRFEIADYPTDIIDNVTGKKYRMSSYYPHMEIICDLLNELHEENQQLKILTKPVQDTIIEEFTITKEDLSNNQRITELTNYALTEFIKSKGYTLKEVNQFIKEEL